MKLMILSFKMKGDVLSDHFLMPWFQKDFLDIADSHVPITGGFKSLKTRDLQWAAPTPTLTARYKKFQMSKYRVFESM